MCCGIWNNLIAIDSKEMRKTHYRIGDDIMGEPKFEGIRIDAEKDHPIGGSTKGNIRYHSIGGVKRADIPEQYPEVLKQEIFISSKV